MKALMDWKHLTFAHPFYFGLLLFVPLMLWWGYRQRRAGSASFRLTTIGGLRSVKPSLRVRLRLVLTVLRIIAIIALTVALARPQSSNTTETIDSDGIDIMMAIDISGSMLAEDFKPNRIEAAKKVAADFVDQRPTDRIGLVIFSGESFTQCPVTIDHAVLKEQIAGISSGLLVDGTAIGDGLSTAVDKLRNTKGKSRIVILLTDGVNNTGKIGPETALEIAKAFKIRVYTIGVGTRGQAPYPQQTPMGTQTMMVPVEIDEALLKKIAVETGGNYYRATNNASLAGIYKQIDKLEKTKVETNSYKHYAELFFPFALLALCAMGAEVLLRNTIYRSIT